VAPTSFAICCPNYSLTYLLQSISCRLALLSCCPNCRLPRNHKLLRVVVNPRQRWRRLKRIIQPRPQVPIEEQLLPQQSRQRRQRPGKRRFQLQILQHQHRDQRRPHLGPDRIGTGPHKRLDLQGLLQRLKQLIYILPINIALRRSRSTTDSILCVHIACPSSGSMSYMTNPTMWCGARMADRWRFRSG